MKLPVLKGLDPMLGCDVHPTGLPLPPIGPHVVTAFLKWGPWGHIPFLANACTKIRTHGDNPTILKGHDIGLGIPHVPIGPFVLALLWSAISGSKCEFGVSSVRMKQGINEGPVAVNFGPTLNCAGPFPVAPTGAVVSSSTHLAGLTGGDIRRGILTMVLDTALACVIACGWGWRGASGDFAERITSILFRCEAVQLADASANIIGRNLETFSEKFLEEIRAPLTSFGLGVWNPEPFNANEWGNHLEDVDAIEEQ